MAFVSPRLERERESIRRRFVGKAERFSSSTNVLIVEPDTRTLVGSKGDEAMLTAIVQACRDSSSFASVGVLVSSEAASSAAESLGVKAVRLNSNNWLLENAVDVGVDFAPGVVVIVGADVMDGYYGFELPAKILNLADVFSFLGARVSMVGFSFNSNPHPALRRIYRSISAGIEFNVRDEISLKRFEFFSGRRARLVSDAAFMLVPQVSHEDDDVFSWVRERKQVGDKVVAFNVHPVLLMSIDDVSVDKMVSASVRAIKSAVDNGGVSFILLAHDYRDVVGDEWCLGRIFDGLKEVGEHVICPRRRMTAAEIKAIAGAADGVVTGRMHLAIASLGMGVPVAAISYQDKFSGLMRHFGLSDDYVLSGRVVFDDGALSGLLSRFLADMESLTAVVRGRLAEVKRLSRLNLDSFLN